jgi:GPH family glycoside/pentoside/hexuronide:cation symporter/glucuronide carrier protein
MAGDGDNIGILDARIKVKEKFAFFSVNLGNIPIMTLISGFLLIFYVNVAGLDPAAVATMFIITRVLDGLNDPIMGYIIDHLPNTRWGRFRPYIVIGTILCGLNYLLLWLGPSMAVFDKLLIAYISYILIGITFDLMDVPLNSLIPVLSTSQKERGSLAVIKSLGYGVGAVIFTIPIVPFVLAFPTQQLGYHAVILIAVAFTIGFSAIGTAGIKERVQPISKERYKARDLLKIFSLVPVFGLFITSLLGSIAGSSTTASAIFYFTYVVGDASLFSIFAIITVLLSGAGLFLAIYLLRKLGNKNIWLYGTIATIIPILPVLFIPPSETLLALFFLGLSRVGAGFAGVVNYAMQADLMDFVEWKRGFRSEGAIASTFSFIVKAGMGIGAAIPGYILSATGFVPNQAHQGSLAILGIDLAFIGIPIILTALSLLCMLFLYPITKNVSKQVQTDLAEKRKAAEKIPSRT